jgi:hypothetical protein
MELGQGRFQTRKTTCLTAYFLQAHIVASRLGVEPTPSLLIPKKAAVPNTVLLVDIIDFFGKDYNSRSKPRIVGLFTTRGEIV